MQKASFFPKFVRKVYFLFNGSKFSKRGVKYLTQGRRTYKNHINSVLFVSRDPIIFKTYK